MEYMNTLFSRILLAQLVAVLLALAVATVITRASLNQSFKGFLEAQEPNVLQTLVPVFADVYESRGGWDFLRNNPQAWQRIWRVSRPQPGEGRFGGPGPRRGGPRDLSGPAGERQNEYELLRWMRPPERGMFRDRLFLLDENQARVIGAEGSLLQKDGLEAIEVDGRTVGWIGFAPMGRVLPPDAERFLRGQVRITVISFVIAFVVALALAYLLAQKVSRPVRQLADTVRNLSSGNYDARADVVSGDETGILAGHVNQLAETLEKNRTARQRWMADIAHELRTPVSILKGEVEALADGVRPADERMSTSLREEIDQLSKLVDDLQTLAMSDAGALNIQKERVDLSDLILQSIDAFRDRLSARGLSLDLQLEAGVSVMADQRRLRQLMLNLLENCSRYVREGGCVKIVLVQLGTAVEIVLEDSGPGLESEQIERLFERFYRVEGSRSRSGGGSGLGLSICRNIVEAHGGQIRAEPSAMGGLRIRVSLPA
jgi:two-component system sensor histidine kinase BaeS